MHDQDKTTKELIKEVPETSFADIFHLADIQHLQDLFADAHGVASIITDPEGKPFTKPSNCTRLCENIIRKTEKGCANCYQSDAIIGRYNPAGAVVQPCMSGGLWDAVASITFGGRHIANWLIGQVRNKEVDEHRMMLYADEIGANKADFKAALNDVPVMSLEQFHKIANLLFVFARELSEKAFSNMQLNKQIAEKEKVNANLQEREENLAITLHSIGDGVISTDKSGLVVRMNPVAEKLCGQALSEAAGKPLAEVFNVVNAVSRKVIEDPVKKVLEIGDVVGLANHTVLISKNGTEYQISDSAAPIKNKEGEITGVVLVFSDVTESYAAQKQIKESEERYRSLLHNLEAGIVVHAPDTSILMNNPRASELLGLTDDQMRGKTAIDPAWTFIDEAKVPLPPGNYPVNRIVSSKKTIKNQILGIQQPGKEDIVWVTVNGFPLLDNVGDIVEIVVSFIDITERKWKDEELMKMKNILSEGEKVANMGAFEYLAETNTTLWSEGEYRIYGLDPEEPSPAYDVMLSKCIHPDDATLLHETFAAAIQGGSVYDLEHRIIRPDGSVRWVHDRANPYFDQNGKLVRYVGATLDITERNLAENLLKESEQRKSELLKKLAEAQQIAMIGSCEWNLQTNEVWWSDETYSIFGVISQDFKPGFEANGKFIHPDDLENYGKSFAHALKTGEELNEIFRLNTPAGDLKYINGKGKVIYDDAGKQSRFIGTVMDITANKQAELLIQEKTEEIEAQNEELIQTNQKLTAAKAKAEESEEEFRLLAEAMPQIVWVTRADGWNIYFNQQWVDYTGLTLEESYGHGWNKPFHPDDQKRAWDAWQNALNNNSTYSLECKLRNKEGFYRWWLIRGAPVPSKNGEIIKWFGTCTDIHNIKLAENELLAAKEKAEENDHLKSAFLANMSHEIRTPMNGILGFSELLKTPGLSGNEQQDYIRIIEKSGVRMLNIINDIIDISKIEAGLIKSEMKESNINEQVEFIYTFFKPEAEEKGIKLSLKNSLPAKEATVITDREKLYAILTNLVKNAIKYTEEGEIEVGYSKKDEALEFYVKDTGIGIPKDRQAAIFERFIQADIENRKARQGAGLGLAITKSYVEMCGGKIWVESEQGIGSTFYFTIPYNAETEEKNVVPEPMPPEKVNKDVSNLKILIAEDDEVSSMLLEVELKTYSREILKVKTGVEAIEIWRTYPDIDLILMDIQMPEMGGYEATRHIRQFNKDVVIIAQTAFGLSGDREKALAAGCNDYIAKPVNKAGLLSLIEKHLCKSV